MKRSTFARKAPVREVRDRSDEFKSFVPQRPRAVMATPLALTSEAPVQLGKAEGFYSEAWRRAVAALPCVLCGRFGQTQCAHRNEGKAGGRKLMDDCWTAALCVACHSEIDQGSKLTREERRSRMDAAILLTLRELARSGAVIPKG
ncbi:hypothetical protein MW290_25570 [Aquincola tertiaricarbonis]|uniref:DUF1364 family protein n=1 Tax=Aquincola tertiaricarbonis TaxID=391953 RepID=A0ABY4S693_AQUTE|nr:hypothetical protein [Aquincola tertiaricarbonis]URI08941.1 hypothetical protein MW290_25570 [Aquincola tertiaricarbonis]